MIAFSDDDVVDGSIPTPHSTLPVDGALDVGGGLGIAAGRHRVLDVVQDANVDAVRGEGVAEGRDGAVAVTAELELVAVLG